MLAQMLFSLYDRGEWDEALARGAEIPDGAHRQFGNVILQSKLYPLGQIHINRGDVDEARTLMRQVDEDFAASDDIQERATVGLGRAIVARAEGRFADALGAAEEAIRGRASAGRAIADAGVVVAVEGRFALGELERADEMLGDVNELPPGDRSPF